MVSLRPLRTTPEPAAKQDVMSQQLHSTLDHMASHLVKKRKEGQKGQRGKREREKEGEKDRGRDGGREKKKEKKGGREEGGKSPPAVQCGISLFLECSYSQVNQIPHLSKDNI